MSHDNNKDTQTREPSAANGARAAHTPPDPFDHVIAGFERVIRAAEAEKAKAEELAAIPDDVPRFVTEYRS